MEDFSGDTQKPIFITGSVRSGTSIVTRALTHGVGIPGYVEGCFIDFLGGFIRVTDFNYNRRPGQSKNKKIMLGHIPKDEFKKEVARWFRTQYEKYSIYNGQWVDKTADKDVAYGLPYAHLAWPNAKFILMKRRPIENVASRMRKFPHAPFKAHCLNWAQINAILIETKKRLPKDVYMEIDQYDIATNPTEVARKLGLFLNLDAAQIQKIEKTFKEDRPEFTGGDETNIKSLEEMGWTEEQKKTFKEICGPLVDRFGWTLGKQYFK